MNVTYLRFLRIYNYDFCHILTIKQITEDVVMFEYDVFLSYSSKDKSSVHPLAERLKQDGLRVWLDEWEIKPGDSIPLKIQHGLEKSHTLLMCM